jgi:hypothetical protein
VSGGIVTGGTCATNAADYAESYNSTDSLEAGEIVATDPSNFPSVLRSTSAGQNNIIGVVSTKPFQVIGTDTAPNGYPIALAGRVPVKVNLEGGAIHAGDKITSSSVSGVGKKATGAGMVIGTALTDYDGTQASGLVEVFVHTSYYDPSSGNALQASSADIGDLNVSGTATINDLHVQTITVSGNLTVTGLAKVVDIEVGGHIITAGGQPVGSILGSAGASATVSIDGTDTTGTIIITTGGNPTAGELAKIVFSQTYGKSPHIVLSASNEAAAGLRYFKGTTSLTDFILNAKDVPTANTTYQFDYFIAQ